MRYELCEAVILYACCNLSVYFQDSSAFKVCQHMGIPYYFNMQNCIWSAFYRDCAIYQQMQCKNEFALDFEEFQLSVLKIDSELEKQLTLRTTR